MKSILYHLPLVLFLIPPPGGIKGSCQDIHFSQFTMTPLLLNPAYAGVYNGNHRAYLNYKNQWQGMGMPGATYTTALFGYDAGLFKKKFSTGYLGAGISAYNDVAGDLKMGTTQLNLSVSGIVYISEKQLLSGGLQGGYVQKSVSSNGMVWDSQWEEISGTFNTSLPSNDIAAVPPYHYADFSAGLLWNYSTEESSLFSNDQMKTTLGISVQHLNRPKQQFNTGSMEKLYSKMTLHGAAQIGIGHTNYDFVPSAVFFKQGTSGELNLAGMIRWTVKEESKYTGILQEMALSAGVQYRFEDAVIPVMLFEYAYYALGISYDANTSSLRQGTQGKGGFEISLRYTNPNPFRPGMSRKVRFL